MFGTDFPVLDFKRTREEIDALDLKPEVRRSSCATTRCACTA